jgi:hypothetical protein
MGRRGVLRIVIMEDVGAVMDQHGVGSHVRLLLLLILFSFFYFPIPAGLIHLHTLFKLWRHADE